MPKNGRGEEHGRAFADARGGKIFPLPSQGRGSPPPCVRVSLSAPGIVNGDSRASVLVPRLLAKLDPLDHEFSTVAKDEL